MRWSASRTTSCLVLAVTGACCLANPTRSSAQESNLPVYLRDRGTGQPVSMFASYIRRGELLIYPFGEYYHDDDAEYKPSDLYGTSEEDFQGKFRAWEGLIFLGYGITDWLAVESEVAVITASLEKDPSDPQSAPKLEESGLGDVEGQVHVRFARENESRPEFFGFFEAVSPANKKDKLIGTADWEFKPGLGLIKGFSWGTMSVRGGAEYSMESSEWASGEYALEYIKRLSPEWRMYLGFEGNQDELSFIPEVQWHITPSIYTKLNTGIGLTSKATDFAPEFGVMFSVPVAMR